MARACSSAACSRERTSHKDGCTGNLVVEQVMSSPRAHDAADVITSLGWSRRVTDRLSVGAEGIGQDLEGFWDPTEADGGAKPSSDRHSTCSQGGAIGWRASSLAPWYTGLR